MNTKKFILSSLIVYVVFEVLNFLIHGVILSDMYMRTASLWRADMDQMMWIIYVGDILKAFLFVFIFTKGLENKGWAEGMRFGLLMGLYVAIGMGFGSYAMYPIPFILALQWFIYVTIQLVICGIVAAIIYKPAKK